MKFIKTALTVVVASVSLSAAAQFPFGHTHHTDVEAYEKAKVSSYEAYVIWDYDEAVDTAVIETAEVDEEGRVTRIHNTQDEDGYIYTYFYDKKGKLTKYTNLAEENEEEDAIITYLVYEKSKLTEAYDVYYEDTTAKILFEYDKNGRLSTKYELNRNYDSKLWEDTLTTTYNYNDKGELLSASEKSNTVGITVEYNYTYMPDGKLKSVQINNYEMGDWDEDGIETPLLMGTTNTTYKYNSKGLVESIEYRSMPEDEPYIVYYRYSSR